MAVEFFGQFLIDQGEVDASHIREALELMEDENPTLGELAVGAEYMSTRQTVDVSVARRGRDLPFGDMAVELGFLTADQLVGVVQGQRARRLPIGQALVRLGYIGSDRIGTLLDAYKKDSGSSSVCPTTKRPSRTAGSSS